MTRTSMTLISALVTCSLSALVASAYAQGKIDWLWDGRIELGKQTPGG